MFGFFEKKKERRTPKTWGIPKDKAEKVLELADDACREQTMMTSYKLNRFVNELIPETKGCEWFIRMRGGGPFVQEYIPFGE